VRVPGAVLAAPAAGDIDNDGQAELVVLTAGDNVVVVEGNGATTPWVGIDPGAFGDRTFSAPALIDRNGDGWLDVVVVVRDGWHTISGPSGLTGQARGFTEPAVSEPAFADLDGDGAFELLMLHADARLRIHRNAPGDVTTIVLDGTPVGSPIVTLLDHETPALLVATAEGCLLGFDPSGAPLPGFPKRFEAGFTGRLAADVAGTRDGVLSRIVLETDSGTLQELQLPAVGQGDFAAPWGMSGGNAARTRSIPSPLPAGPRDRKDDEVREPEGIVSLRPLANPARAGGPVAFELTGTAPATRLEVFDLLGRRRAGRAIPPDLADSPGVVTWDGRTDEGMAPPAGLYFVRVSRSAGPPVVGRLLLVP
jgi:hypothetical protein